MSQAGTYYRIRPAKQQIETPCLRKQKILCRPEIQCQLTDEIVGLLRMTVTGSLVPTQSMGTRNKYQCEFIRTKISRRKHSQVFSDLSACMLPGHIGTYKSSVSRWFDRWKPGRICVRDKLCRRETIHKILIHVKFHIRDAITDFINIIKA